MRSNRKSQWRQFKARHRFPSSRDFRRVSLYGAAGAGAGGLAGGVFAAKKPGYFRDPEKGARAEKRQAVAKETVPNLMAEQNAMVDSVARMCSREIHSAFSGFGLNPDNFAVAFNGSDFRILPRVPGRPTPEIEMALEKIFLRYRSAVQAIKEDYADKIRSNGNNAQKAGSLQEPRAGWKEIGAGALTGGAGLSGAILAGVLAAYGAARAKRAFSRFARKNIGRPSKTTAGPVVPSAGQPANARGSARPNGGNGAKGNGQRITPAKKSGNGLQRRVRWSPAREFKMLSQRLENMGKKAALTPEQMVRLRTLSHKGQVRSRDYAKIVELIDKIRAENGKGAPEEVRALADPPKGAAQPAEALGNSTGTTRFYRAYKVQRHTLSDAELLQLWHELGFFESGRSGGHLRLAHQTDNRTAQMSQHRGDHNVGELKMVFNTAKVEPDELKRAWNRLGFKPEMD